MKLSCQTRDDDGMPILLITAESNADKKALKKLSNEMWRAQKIGILNGLSGRFNTCGSEGDRDGLRNLVVPVLLGGGAEAAAVEKAQREV